MSSVIGLLMLAIALLQAVRDNPSLPQPFKDQATTIALQAISAANAYVASSTPLTSTPIAVGTTIPLSMPQDAVQPAPVSFEVYGLKLETDDNYYYTGEKELDTAAVGGVPSTITASQYLPNDCINIWKGGTIEKKVCGYWMARFTRSANDNDSFVLTAKDGSTYSGGFVQ